ncbi:hypothetical protein GDO86_000080 [Hymenochirus boettgeri]|uniref:Uncharacterized protein n=1 Tax=Hymenochirus boettgeri TaxID=247094 RepID=A0A8T2KBN1_9PIPI|nr:hypothetical protein GDO86_000080 [Hymenochirus boettgeri]
MTMLNIAGKDLNHTYMFLHLSTELMECLTHPFPENDSIHSAAPFMFWLIIRRTKRPLCGVNSEPFQCIQCWEAYNVPLCFSV